jgi:hypothetical protein
MEQVFADLMSRIRELTVAGDLNWRSTADENAFVATMRLQGNPIQLEISRYERPDFSVGFIGATTTAYALVIRQGKPATSTTLSSPELDGTQLQEIYDLAARGQRVSAAQELLELLRESQPQTQNSGS